MKIDEIFADDPYSIKQNRFIKEIPKVVTHIGNLTYENFLDSFRCLRSEYGDATNLEAEIAALFLIDYIILGELDSQMFRLDLKSACIRDLLGRYKLKVDNSEAYLPWIIYDRYSQYEKIFDESVDWQLSFHNLLEVNLFGTKNKNALEEVYSIRLYEGIDPISEPMQFKISEIRNFHRTAKMVEVLMDGKSTADAIKLIEVIEGLNDMDK